MLDYFCKKFPASHLAKTLPYCAQYETYTEDKGELHPWATWPTLHRGISNQHHQIKDFGQNLEKIDKEYPPIWKILTAQSISTGVFASMNSYPLPQNYGSYDFYVPDPFAADSQAYPGYVVPFQAFNLGMSRRSEVNVDGGIDIKAALKNVSKPSVSGNYKGYAHKGGRSANRREKKCTHQNEAKDVSIGLVF